MKNLKVNVRSDGINTIHGHLSDFVVTIIKNIQAVVMGIQTHSIWPIQFFIIAHPSLQVLSLDLVAYQQIDTKTKTLKRKRKENNNNNHL
jgi:hypothetical protein